MPRLHALLAALLLTQTAACATKVQAPTDAPALGGDARIVVKKNKTGTYALDLEIDNLPPPARLADDASAFVVWLVAPEQAAVRAGVLAYDEGGRRGALEASSPGASFTVLVTVEKEASPASPSGATILRAAIAAR